MPQTFQEIYDSLIEGKKIKPNSKFENSLKIKARKIVEKQEFEELKARIIGMADKLIQLGIMNSAQYRLIKNSQNKAQLDEQILKLTKNFLNLISSVNIEKFTLEETKLWEQEINNLKKKHSSELKEIEYASNKNIKKLKEENKMFSNENRKLTKELKKYRTPDKIISDYVEAYIQLIKNEPSKKPTPESLADFSKGKSFELSRSSWAEKIKSSKFIKMAGLKLIEEYEKGQTKIENVNKKIQSLQEQYEMEKNEGNKNSLKKKIEKIYKKETELLKITNHLDQRKNEFVVLLSRIEKKNMTYRNDPQKASDKEQFKNYDYKREEYSEEEDDE